MNLLNNLRVFAQKDWSQSKVSIFFVEKIPGTNRISVVTNFELQEFESTTVADPETLNISMTAAQELMDSLWDCGIRPSEGSGSAGALKATQDHLKDMQEFSKRLLSLVEIIK